MKQTEDKINFAKNIRILRKIYGRSQKQMAQIMDCSLYCVQKAEQGIFVQSLYVDALINLCRHFHLPPSALFAPPDLHTILESLPDNQP